MRRNPSSLLRRFSLSRSATTTKTTTTRPLRYQHDGAIRVKPPRGSPLSVASCHAPPLTPPPFSDRTLASSSSSSSSSLPSCAFFYLGSTIRSFPSSTTTTMRNSFHSAVPRRSPFSTTTSTGSSSSSSSSSADDKQQQQQQQAQQPTDENNHNNNNNSNKDNPLQVVQQAMDSLEEFSAQLRQVAQQVDEPHLIEVKKSSSSSSSSSLLLVPPSKARKISLAEITLHSRDVESMEEFQSPLAQAARTELRTCAQAVEERLKQMIETYTTVVQPQMERATKLCQETPCGGATWELDLDRLLLLQKQQKQHPEEEEEEEGTTKNQQVTLRGEHGTLDGTPCGRLQVASLKFLETTLETKPQILMASRARIILDLVMNKDNDDEYHHLNSSGSLQMIRKHGTVEQKKTIQRAFQSQQVLSRPLPWIRSDAEYQALLQIKQGLVKTTT